VFEYTRPSDEHGVLVPKTPDAEVPKVRALRTNFGKRRSGLLL
jgi:hypothetical protein